MKNRLGELVKEIHQQRKFLTLLEDENIKHVHISEVLGKQDQDDLVLALSVDEVITHFTYDANGKSDSADLYSQEITQRDAIMLGLEKNKNIVHLDLSKTCVGELSTTQPINPAKQSNIPKFLETNHVLSFLDLSNNGLGDGVGKLIGEGLRGNSTIKHLNLSNNALTCNGIERIMFTLLYNDTLEYLDISTNTIGTQGAKHLKPLLEISKTLSYLNLKSNALSSAGGQFIADGLLKNSSVTHLDLSSNGIGGGNNITDGIKSLASMLIKNTTIKLLNLKYNYIFDIGMTALTEGLLSNTSLTYLNLAHNGTINKSGALSKLLLQSSSISKLDIAQTSFELGEIKNTTEAIAANKFITELNLSSCRLDEKMGVLLATYLTGNKTLQKIDLSNNNISEATMVLLAKAINDTGITHLNISNNVIGTKGAEAVGCLVNRLKYLNCSSNKLLPEAANLLAAGLAGSKNLTALDVSGNGDMKESGSLIVKALGDNHSLIYLNLSGLNIGEKGIQQVATSLPNIKSLAILNLAQNNIGYSLAILQHLSLLIKSNPFMVDIDITGNDLHPSLGSAVLDAVKPSAIIGFKYWIQVDFAGRFKGLAPSVDYKDSITLHKYKYQEDLKKLDSLSPEECVKVFASETDSVGKKLILLINQTCTLKNQKFLYPELSYEVPEFKSPQHYLEKISAVQEALSRDDNSDLYTKELIEFNLIGHAMEYVADTFL